MQSAPSRYGAAYGLGIDGLDADLAELDAAWPRWTVQRRSGADERPVQIAESRAWIPLVSGGGVEVDRASQVFEFVTPEPLPERALAHPYLAPAAAVAALWSGAVPLHGGVFVAGGAAWIVLGAAASGKTTLLAGLARRDVPVLSDDLAVIRDGQVAVGPRCIDLRADVARELGIGEPLGVVGTRERWRISLPPAPASAPLGGFVALDWGDEITDTDVFPTGRLRALSANLAVVTGGAVPALLDLADLPMVRIERPRGLDRLDDVVTAVLNRVERRKF